MAIPTPAPLSEKILGWLRTEREYKTTSYGVICNSWSLYRGMKEAVNKIVDDGDVIVTKRGYRATRK